MTIDYVTGGRVFVGYDYYCCAGGSKINLVQRYPAEEAGDGPVDSKILFY